MRFLVLFSLIFFVTTGWPSVVQANSEYLGVRLPRGSRVSQGDRDRWYSGKDFSETVAFFKSTLGQQEGIRIFQSVSLPRVQSVHVENATNRGRWTGINISLIGRRVYIYFIKRKG